MARSSKPSSAADFRIWRFQQTVWEYYRRNKRQFPWRNTTDPYEILVSEVMLQQTQTGRVVDKYLAFIAAFPTFNALAKAKLAVVLQKWQGLGYNRRALSLKRIAEYVINDGGGALPQTVEGLDALPGIGYATACSIRAFAWNLPAPFIETNIRRVYIHFFFPKAESVKDEEILKLVEKTMDMKKPREWYYALMDYGSMLKTIVPNPNRKSAHYSKQAAFEGSNRQVRGAIVRLLTARKRMEKAKIHTIIGFDREKTDASISALCEEGFLRQSKGVVRIDS